MEQASQSSQHAAVLARCSESEARCAALEAESKVWAREREESVARMEALSRDHERMTALQQRQEVELEELLDKHSQLRSNNRSLEAQHRELEARYKHTAQNTAQVQTPLPHLAFPGDIIFTKTPILLSIFLKVATSNITGQKHQFMHSFSL